MGGQATSPREAPERGDGRKVCPPAGSGRAAGGRVQARAGAVRRCPAAVRPVPPASLLRESRGRGAAHIRTCPAAAPRLGRAERTPGEGMRVSAERSFWGRCADGNGVTLCDVTLPGCCVCLQAAARSEEREQLMFC